MSYYNYHGGVRYIYLLVSELSHNSLNVWSVRVETVLLYVDRSYSPHAALIMKRLLRDIFHEKVKNSAAYLIR